MFDDLTTICFLFLFSGFIIYFSYGIWNSAEATLASNASDDDNSFVPNKPMRIINGPPTPEKRAFLAQRVNVGEVEDEEEEEEEDGDP